SPTAVEAVKKNLGLDQPILVQYGRWVKGVVAGADYQFGPTKEHCPAPCFGYSFKNHQPVWPLLMNRLPVTASLAAGASVIWLLGGVSIGVLSALRRGSFFDRLSMATALAGVSLPIFFTGLVSLALFSYRWRIFPSVHYVSFADNPLLWARNLTLPWVTLAFLYAALYARLTRAGMLDTMHEDYIRTARAKGLPERTVVLKHGLRSALTPILTIFGLDVGLLLGGAVLTESTFSLPGIGKFAVDAIRGSDLPEVLGVVMLGTVFIVTANLVVDVLYAALDPKVRLG
ncbi:MAG TPA: ABC transporter permease, partial [Angustibacter sp.]|nr:ABC transporter permease [Angustibacter sp.]